MSARPFVTIIIPTKNNGATIVKCLESLTKLDYPNYEIIVVDGHSTDGTDKIALKYGCTVIYEDIGTRAGAINVGLRVAKGDIVAFTDADCVVDRHWLDELVKCYYDDSVAGVGGPNYLIGTDVFSKILRFLSNLINTRWILATSRVTQIDHNVGCNSSYRKEILLSIGGFDEKLVTAEDLDIDYRIRQRGYKLIFTPTAKVYHFKHFTFKKFIKWCYRFGYGKGQLIKKYRKLVFSPLHLLLGLLLLPYGIGMIVGYFRGYKGEK